MSDDLIDRLKARCVYGDARLLLWKKHDPLSAEAAAEIYRLRAEIERLTKERDTARNAADFLQGQFNNAIARAEKAEAERDQAVAAAFEAAANIVVTGEPEISPITRHAITALTSAEARAALEAYGREKVREGMQRAIDLAMQPNDDHGMMFAEAYEFRDIILADMETLK